MTPLRSRVVVALLLPVLGFSLLVLPGRETLAACRPGTPCIENFRATPFETVGFPQMDWTLLGEVQGPASKGHDSGMLSGDATVTLNDLGANPGPDRFTSLRRCACLSAQSAPDLRALRSGGQ